VKKPESPEKQNNRVALQAGAFLNQRNADKMNTRLRNKGFDSRVLILEDSKDRTWYLVRSGRYANQEDAKKAAITLKQTLGTKPVIRPVGSW